MNPVVFLRAFSIRSRLLAVALASSLLVVVVGALGLWGLHKLDAISASFVAGTHESAVQSIGLATALGDIRRYEKDMVINYEKPAAVADYKKKWGDAVAQADKVAAGFSSGGAEQAAAGREIQRLLADYSAKAAPVIRQIEASGYDSAAVANKMFGPSKEAIRTAEKTFDSLVLALEQQALASRAASLASQQRTQWLFGGAVALAVVLVLSMAAANAASICRPIDSARSVTDRIAGGDLGTPVEVTGRDEPARLVASLSAMQGAFGALVRQVRDASETIRTASSEVASGSFDLSQRTEEAASNLQRTASSMEELTSTVNQTADSARTANQLAASASTVARRGGTVVAQVVSTMDEISHSSRKIADIIGTIDGIAFQTNILALNAAVEAARAGEQGRGFAVVAGEVRNLAQRSAEAAKEIKTLINASVEKTAAGSKLVADAGSTMGEIVASVQRVSDIIGEISAAASEQSAGIGQVNDAVAQLDQATQQNAALVEESSAAAEALKQQSEQLGRVVATFRLAAHEQGPPHASPQSEPPRPPPAATPSVRARRPAATATAAVVAPVRTTAPHAVASKAIDAARRAATPAAAAKTQPPSAATARAATVTAAPASASPKATAVATAGNRSQDSGAAADDDWTSF